MTCSGADTLRVNPAAVSVSGLRDRVRLVRSHVFGPSMAGFRVTQPIAVTVQCADARYVISDEIFNVFGQGATWTEAEQDFVGSLIDYYLIMADSHDEATAEVVRHLETYLRPA